MQYTSTKVKVLIFLIISVAVFLGLFLLGTFFDFEISQKLTQNTLAPNQYYTTNGFALFFKTVGSTPIWLALAIAFAMATAMTAKTSLNKWLKIFLCIVLAIASWVVLNEMTKDVLTFALQPFYLQDILITPTINATRIFFTTVLWLLIGYCCRKVKPSAKTWRFFLVIISSCALFVVISLIKTPFGRVRFRTINILCDTTLYTPWYKINGSRTFDGLPYDCCKSFPSGHTFSAGMVFLLLCLPDFFDFAKQKYVRIILWVSTICYVVAVALSRIVAGAHYLTDVTFSFALSLFGTLFFRELYLTNFANLKLLKSSKKQ